MDTLIKMHGVSELTRKRSEDPAVLLIEESMSLNLSCTFVDRNFADMKNLIVYFANNDNFMSLHINQRNYVSEELCTEISLSIVNYIASVIALLEHIEKLHGKLHRPKGKITDFNTQVNVFETDGKLKFIKDLRNYFAHYKAIFVRPQMTLDKNEGLSMSVILHRENLLEWKDYKGKSEWSAKAREFLQADHNAIDVLSTLIEYQNKLAEFTQWFRVEQKDALAEEWKVYDEYDRLLDKEIAEDAVKLLEELGSNEEISMTTFEAEVAAIMPLSMWKLVDAESQTQEERFLRILKAMKDYGADETKLSELAKQLRSKIIGLEKPDPEN